MVVLLASAAAPASPTSVSATNPTNKSTTHERVKPGVSPGKLRYTKSRTAKAELCDGGVFGDYLYALFSPVF